MAPDQPVCTETSIFIEAESGVCPIHHGDACLAMVGVAVVGEKVMGELAALHTPMNEEVECWVDDENGAEEHDRRFPECPGAPDGDADQCAGHVYTMQVCSECGTHGQSDEVYYRPWPCATLRAVGFVPSIARPVAD